jgi:hypothetical protein
LPAGGTFANLEENMANCDNLFREFNKTIKLSETKKDSLRASRNALRKKVKDKFKQEGFEVKFYWQGSFAMRTIITPKDGGYDIDDGIYVQGDDLPEVPIETLHTWIVQAAKDHTSIEPKDKNTCVRVFFKDGHHIDLVLYHKKENEHPKLAHKVKGWTPSDPKEFMDWFNPRCDKDGQAKRIVQYLKAWADNIREEIPGGIILTILAINNLRLSDRDDVAFLDTMKSMYGSLSIQSQCMRPTTAYEDLLADYSQSKRNYFMGKLSAFIQSGNQAMEMTNQKDACPKWQKHFGDRFPCGMAEDNLDDAKSFASPAFIKSDARSA